LVKPTRLTRNRHGAYCLRWIVPADLRASCQGRREVRFSLRTTDSSRARTLALEFNLALERIKAMSRSKTRPVGVTPMTLTMGGLSVEIRDDNDRRLFDAFLKENPDLREQMLSSIRSGQPPADAATNLMAQVKAAANAIAGVDKPTLLSDAIDQFLGSRQGLARNRRSTVGEKERRLQLLQEHLEAKRKPGQAIFVHEILRADAIEFTNAYASRPGKGATKPGRSGCDEDSSPSIESAPKSKHQEALSARTVIKAIGHLRDFFTFALGSNMLKAHPLDDAFERATQQVRKEASAAKQDNSYELMDEDEILRIFEPRMYLQHMNAADDFWAPLIGLYTGARLGEIVTLPADGIFVDEARFDASR
jgi:hypothetical protein